MDAARAAIGSEAAADDAQPGRRKSMLGGLTRAFSRKASEAEAAVMEAPAVDAPSVDLDQPLEPKAVNRPLEPGSGAPDLGAIMRRVRDERSQPAKAGMPKDVGGADFIAAARRHAQAAAAEAEILKKQAKVEGPVKALRIGDLFKARRKPVLMGAVAIMLALTGLVLGKAVLSDPQQASATTPPTAVVASVASADAAPSLAGDKARDDAGIPGSAAIASSPVRQVDTAEDGKAGDVAADSGTDTPMAAIEPALRPASGVSL